MITCQTGETFTKYSDYLKSSHWNNVKKAYRLTHDYVCTKCGVSKKGLHLHHRTYERIGNEQHEDLVYLCNTCHMEEHKGDGRAKRRQPKEKVSEFMKMYSFICSNRRKIKELPENLVREFYEELMELKKKEIRENIEKRKKAPTN